MNFLKYKFIFKVYEEGLKKFSKIYICKVENMYT